MTRSKKIIIASIATLVIALVGFYFLLPALNVYSKDFWIGVIALVIVWGVAYLLTGIKDGAKKVSTGKLDLSGIKGAKWFFVVVAIPLAVLIVGGVASSTFFNAHAYSNIIEVPEAVFENDMPETNTVTNIALMDSSSAAKIGNRTLGALSEVVSQYQAGEKYSQINLEGVPAKVTNLEYADFFKWINNRDAGVPGYIYVDPVNSDAKFIYFDESIKYVQSAYFNDNLQRKLRFEYPTKIFDEITFEIDEEGNPYYIVSCMMPKIGMFGAMDVNEVIIFNPVDGSSELYSVEDTPAWVDNVYNGYLATQKYDWYGMYKNGFWNSIIGNKDCKVTTDDFGYIIRDDDVLYYTGVTSITADESNIGFITSNARTGEYKFYSVIGAEEYSAMQVAEGKVQEKGYVASFPALINVSGQPTYIMVLKDSGGVVQLYALVNVENYSIVATGSNQTEAKKAYVDLILENGVIEDAPEDAEPEIEEYENADITIADVKTFVLDGTSWVYITAEDGTVYKQSVVSDERMVFVTVGDKISVKYTKTDIEKIKQIVDFSYVTK